MKQLFILLFSIPFLFGPPSNLERAYQNFADKKYAEATQDFAAAAVQYPLEAPKLQYNIGICQLQMDSVEKARNAWTKAIVKEDKKLSSLAHNNLGCLKATEQDPKTAQDPKAGKENIQLALESFKNALRLDPDNELARYNYELLMKKQQEQQNQEQQEQNQDQEKKDQNQDQEESQDKNQDQEQQQDKKDDEGDEEKESQQQNQSSSPQNNQKPNAKEGQGDQVEYKDISMEQAKMLLEGMKENEKKFLQELKKSPKKKNPDEGTPDW